MKTVEVRVLVKTSDESAAAADRITSLITRSLHRELDAQLCYVELVTTRGT